MLDKVLAGKFMERVRSYTDYNVNIMDEKGIIIASKDEKRVGSFHEVAYRILQGEGDEISVSEKDEFLGVKEGVNIAIVENRKRIGVIGITGKAREIKPIALVMKMAVETMPQATCHTLSRMVMRALLGKRASPRSTMVEKFR